MRYIAKVLKNSLHEKFPDASEDELMKVEVPECAVLTVYVYECVSDGAVIILLHHTKSKWWILVTFWQIVGNLLYYRYMNPAIVAPDGFDIIEMSAGGQLALDQRRNLGSVAKMLQHAAANKLFEGENAHMTPMNIYISQTYEKFRYVQPHTLLMSMLLFFYLWEK